jgi:hypothetical protein
MLRPRAEVGRLQLEGRTQGIKRNHLESETMFGEVGEHVKDVARDNWHWGLKVIKAWPLHGVAKYAWRRKLETGLRGVANQE